MSNAIISPAVSEIEFDISKSISNVEKLNRAKCASLSFDRQPCHLDAGAILDQLVDTDGEGDEAFIEAQQAALNRKTSNLKGKTVKKGGGFLAMGLDAHLLKAIARKGFNVPTPIQRKTIPLVLDHQDVVGMARTGSGKTAAFVIPMIQMFKAHSTRIGARALILSPSRELALQTLMVVKEFSRGTDLKSVLLVGGDNLEDQFGLMTANPDIIIATPGRFLHLKIEMSLDLSSVKYVVFDEADRLFEMGFSIQLNEILHALPTSRQTLLFSATLPVSLVEFAKAGLQDPILIRLDAETKISPDLESAFFNIKSGEKEAALLYVLNDIIKIPSDSLKSDPELTEKNKKRKRGAEGDSKNMPTEHSTIIFVATKHHVEYLAMILHLSGFSVSYAYGSLDQVARNTQVRNFRLGITNIFVVTDVAARGIDIPILANVINYDFPPQPKIFVHRVGRTARAGQRGWSYSLVRDTDVPYLLDLQLFLGKKLLFGKDIGYSPNFAEDIIFGTLSRDKIETNMEWIVNMVKINDNLQALRLVSAKGERLYMKTRNSASGESVKRAKQIVKTRDWIQGHVLFHHGSSNTDQARIDMLTRVGEYRPQETIFEVETKKKLRNSELVNILKQRRAKIRPKNQLDNDQDSTAQVEARGDPDKLSEQLTNRKSDTTELTVDNEDSHTDEISDNEHEITFSNSFQKMKERSLSWKDPENFMSYTPKNSIIAEENGYKVHSEAFNTASRSSSFLQAARSVTMDLVGDDAVKSFAEPVRAKGMRWDKKNKKYVARANDEDGSRGAKVIRGESGQKISASFQSGRFNKWRQASKLDRLPRVGELEKSSIINKGIGLDMNQRFKHKQMKAPKEADPYRDDYHVQKKRVKEAKEKRIGKWRDGNGQQEIKSIDDIRKERRLSQRKKAKNSRPVKKARR